MLLDEWLAVFSIHAFPGCCQKLCNLCAGAFRILLLQQLTTSCTKDLQHRTLQGMTTYRPDANELSGKSYGKSVSTWCLSCPFSLLRVSHIVSSPCKLGLGLCIRLGLGDVLLLGLDLGALSRGYRQRQLELLFLCSCLLLGTIVMKDKIRKVLTESMKHINLAGQTI